MSLVLDSSVTLAWTYKDESTTAALVVLDQVRVSGAVVPSLWRLEVANSLKMAVRRGRIDTAFRNAALADLTGLPILVDMETDHHAWGETLRLADKHRLTLYDACYLELVLRHALPLATLDADLHAAAKAEGIALLGR